MSDVLEPTPDPEWVLHHEGYNSAASVPATA